MCTPTLALLVLGGTSDDFPVKSVNISVAPQACSAQPRVPQAPEATEPKATPEATPKETPKATEPDAAAPEEEAEGGKKTTKAKSKSKKKAKPVEVEVEVQVGS